MENRAFIELARINVTIFGTKTGRSGDSPEA
jgi:hypothetical protein